MYGWGNGVDDACGTNGEAAMYGAANTPEPCLPVAYAHTHPDEFYSSMVAELDLMCVLCMGL